MKAGKYFVGDLCYVLDSMWDEFCDLTIEENQCKDGLFKFQNGMKFATFRTMYGDGSFLDSLYRLSNSENLPAKRWLKYALKLISEGEYKLNEETKKSLNDFFEKDYEIVVAPGLTEARVSFNKRVLDSELVNVTSNKKRNKTKI